MAENHQNRKLLSEGEAHLAVLRGLLSYHNRMWDTIDACKKSTCGDSIPCMAGYICDVYRAALEESIRCIKIVHKIEDNKEVI